MLNTSNQDNAIRPVEWAAFARAMDIGRKAIAR
jgi:hypothetical protein